MKYRKFVTGSLAVLILVSSVIACSSAKDVEERRNFMMPKKSEMSRNSRYKEPGKRKTNNSKSHRSKSKSLF
ncbi:MAG TPA: hypothetical protein VK179_02940 [Bacteroidales bacterium]|nr:hypothetical protein [Bacteroidales bacterium]